MESVSGCPMMVFCAQEHAGTLKLRLLPTARVRLFWMFATETTTDVIVSFEAIQAQEKYINGIGGSQWNR